MRPTTTTINNAIDNSTLNYIKLVDVKLKSGVTFTITEDDLWDGGVSMEQSTSSNGFQVGTAIVNRFDLTIYNDGKYDAYNFSEAEISYHIKVGNTDIPIMKGVISETPETDGSIMNFSGYDFMIFFDKPYVPYKGSDRTLRALAEYCMRQCGFTNILPSFTGEDDVIDSLPDMENLSYRQVISWIAQITCTNAVVNSKGNFQFRWYGSPENAIELKNTKSVSVGKTPVYFTGVRVTEYQSEMFDEEISPAEPKSVLIGEEGYVLKIEGNRLIQSEAYCQLVATRNFIKLSSMELRPITAEIFTDPRIECGDAVKVKNGRGETFIAYVNYLDFCFGNRNTLSCRVDTATSKNAQQPTILEQTVADIKRSVAATMKQVQQFSDEITNMISQGYGMNRGKVTLPNGGIVDGMYDGATPEQSSYIFYWTSNGIMASVDGGATWAIDKNGNALMNALTVNKLTADQIDVNEVFARELEATKLKITGESTFGNLFINESGNVAAVDGDLFTTIAAGRIDLYKGSPNGQNRVSLNANDGSGHLHMLDADEIWVGSTCYTKVPNIQFGSTPATDCAAGTVTQIDVEFATPFATVPAVVACMHGNSSAATIGAMTILVANITASGFSIRVHNNSSSSRKPSIRWIAVAN